MSAKKNATQKFPSTDQELDPPFGMSFADNVMTHNIVPDTAAIAWANKVLRVTSQGLLKEVVEETLSELHEGAAIWQSRLDLETNDWVANRLAHLEDASRVATYASALFAMTEGQKPSDAQILTAKFVLLMELLERVEGVMCGIPQEKTITAGDLKIRVRPGKAFCWNRNADPYGYELPGAKEPILPFGDARFVFAKHEHHLLMDRAYAIVRANYICINDGWYGPFGHEHDILVDHGMLVVDGVAPELR